MHRICVFTTFSQPGLVAALRPPREHIMSLRPLEGVSVVELAVAIAGPSAAGVLCDCASPPPRAPATPASPL